MTAPALRGIRAALVFLTRIPLGGFPYQKEDWRWAAAHAPFVGILIGATLGVCNTALLPLGKLPAAALTLGIALLLTGAFHEDGLADTCDALGGAHDREQVLAILKDSRIGAFGGSAIAISLLARCALIAELKVPAVWALCLVGGLARLGPLALMRCMPYLTRAKDSKSRDVVQIGAAQLTVAVAWCVIASGTAWAVGQISGARLASATLALLLVTVACGAHFWRRVQGVTGDFLGATEQFAEMALLAVFAWPE